MIYQSQDFQSTNVISEFRDEYRWLSNFHYSPIYHEGLFYQTVEHAYQASKTKDQEIRMTIAILLADKAGEAKRIGNIIKKRKDWDVLKIGVMEELLRKKFSQTIFKNLLLATHDLMLIEGNRWHDNFWGNCVCLKCGDVVGQNNLGKLIMKIRKDIQ